MGYNPLINGVYRGYNPLTNHLLTSWDIQVSRMGPMTILQPFVPLGNSGTVPARFPPPLVGWWWISLLYVMFFGIADAEKGDF